MFAWVISATTAQIAPKDVINMKHTESLEKILQLIRQWGGEDAAVNYQLLVQIRKIAINALNGGNNVSK